MDKNSVNVPKGLHSAHLWNESLANAGIQKSPATCWMPAAALDHDSGFAGMKPVQDVFAKSSAKVIR
jgi:hypothetical protein